MNETDEQSGSKFKRIAKEIFLFLTSKIFLKGCLMMSLFIGAMLLIAMAWLWWYTDHGEAISVGNYIGKSLDETKELAAKSKFKLLVSDSLYIVDRPGGTVIEQDPRPGSKVKENRTIYIKTAKYTAEQVSVSTFPTMYGKEFPNIKRLFEKRYKINTKVRKYKYDPGPENCILEVYYDGDRIVSSRGKKDNVKIEKGGTVEFVLSSRSGVPLVVPNLTCKKFKSARFLASSNKVQIGKINLEKGVTDTLDAFVWKQIPDNYGERLPSGRKIEIFLSKDLPPTCK